MLFNEMLFLAFNSTNAQTAILKGNPLKIALGLANLGYGFAKIKSQTVTIYEGYLSIIDDFFDTGPEYHFILQLKYLKDGMQDQI